MTLSLTLLFSEIDILILLIFVEPLNNHFENISQSLYFSCSLYRAFLHEIPTRIKNWTLQSLIWLLNKIRWSFKKTFKRIIIDQKFYNCVMQSINTINMNTHHYVWLYKYKPLSLYDIKYFFYAIISPNFLYVKFLCIFKIINLYLTVNDISESYQ